MYFSFINKIVIVIDLTYEYIKVNYLSLLPEEKYPLFFDQFFSESKKYWQV